MEESGERGLLAPLCLCLTPRGVVFSYLVQGPSFGVFVSSPGSVVPGSVVQCDVETEKHSGYNSQRNTQITIHYFRRTGDESCPRTQRCDI
jgi:hypothetical protein